MSRTEACAQQGWLAGAELLAEARGGPLLAWVDAGVDQATSTAGMGFVVGVPCSCKVVVCAALRRETGARTPDVNEWEVAAAAMAATIICQLRSGHAALISDWWEGGLRAAVRQRVEEKLVWPVERQHGA